MNEILNLAIKKDVFEKLINGDTNEIPIKKNDWWKKRLMDPDTGRFRDFKLVCVTCFKSQKYYYGIENIKLLKNYFYITVFKVDMDDLGDSDSDIGDSYIDTHKNETQNLSLEQEIEQNVINNNSINPETINKHLNIHYPEQDEEVGENTQDSIEIKDAILSMFNDFCNHKDVFIVNMPNVTIRNTGQIVGCNKKRLIADRDSDVRFEFNKHEFIQYAGTTDIEFVKLIYKFLEYLLNNNYVFVNKNYCGFDTSTYGELMFKIAMVTKKKYLFKYR